MKLSLFSKAKKEKRGAYRVSPPGLRLLLRGKSSIYPIAIHDMSVSGVAINANTPSLKPGVVFRCDIAQDQNILISGVKVRIVRRAGSLIGGQFLNKTEEQELRLGEIVLSEQKRLKACKDDCEPHIEPEASGKPIIIDDPWAK